MELIIRLWRSVDSCEHCITIMITKNFKEISFLIFIVFVVFFLSCNNKIPTIIEGEWKDIPPETLLGGERYNFSFRGKTFEIQKFIYSDVAISKCNKTTYQYNYYEGDFELRGDSLYLNGKLTKSTYLDSTQSEKIVPDCMNLYGKEYKYVYHYAISGDTLKLRPREGHWYGSNNYDEKDSIGSKIIRILTIYLKK